MGLIIDPVKSYSAPHNRGSTVFKCSAKGHGETNGWWRSLTIWLEWAYEGTKPKCWYTALLL